MGLRNKSALSPVQVAVSRMLGHHAFFSHLFLDLCQLVETEQIPVAATDGRYIWTNPKAFGEMAVDERVFVLVHEVCHIILEHLDRWRQFKSTGRVDDMPLIPELLHKAADYVINAILVDEEKLPMPRGEYAGLYRDDIRSDMDLTDAYRVLFNESVKNRKRGSGGQGGQGGQGQDKQEQGSGGQGKQEQGQGQGKQEQKQGQGQGGQGKNRDGNSPPPPEPESANHGGFDTHLMPNPDEPPLTGKQLMNALAMAATVAKSCGQGPPAGMAAIIDEYLRPKVPWTEHLQHLLIQITGGDSQSWQRPNRKRLALPPRMVWPGNVSPKLDKLLTGIDVSGSISQEEYEAYMGEYAGILGQINIETSKLYFADTAVQLEVEVNSADEFMSMQLQPPAGGGTYMPAIFEHAEQTDFHPDVAVIFTDGHTPWGEPPDYPVIWCVTTGQQPPFGHLVRLQDN